jgi:Glycosyltransferase family 87
MQGMETSIQNVFMAHGDHILFRNKMHYIEDETVLLEDKEVNILAADHLNGPADCVVRKYRGTLFGKFYEQYLLRRTGGVARIRRTVQLPNRTQNAADEHSDPPIDELQLAGIEWRSHKVTIAVSGSATGMNSWQERSLISIFRLSNPHFLEKSGVRNQKNGVWSRKFQEFRRQISMVGTNSDNHRIWNTCACILWLAVLVVLILRPLMLSHRGTSFDTYQLAGSHWLEGEKVYTQWMGFVYSPVVAAFFAPFAWMPAVLGNILWRMLNAALLLGGLAAILKANLFSGIKESNFGIVYLLLVPLAVGNIDISQANPLVEGLLLLAIAAVYTERWNIAALSVAIAICFKIYPIAVGLLICLIAPRRFSWRMLAALLLLLMIPFLFQHWSYVSNQYRDWIATRTSDDRRQWPIEKLPLDLWFLIHWVGHLPITAKVYSLIQLGSAGLLALFCAFQTWKDWAKDRVLIGLFCLVSIWMTLCGPATESYTYLILAPAIVLALVQAFGAAQPTRLRALVSAAFILQLLAATRASFLPHFKPFLALSIQPFSALVFLVYTLLWLFDNSVWMPASHETVH